MDALHDDPNDHLYRMIQGNREAVELYRSIKENGNGVAESVQSEVLSLFRELENARGGAESDIGALWKALGG
jgi:hypothetical protein